MTEDELAQSWTGLEAALRKDMGIKAEPRCDFWDLFVSQCGCPKHRNSDAWWESDKPVDLGRMAVA